MSEAYQYDDGCRLLIFRYADEECQALMAHYNGIRFNQVRLTILPQSALQDVPDREEIEMTFNISGMPFDLTRHGFCAPQLVAHGTAIRHHTSLRHGRIRAGVAQHPHPHRFSPPGAQYVDGMTKLTLALRPIFHARRFVRGVTPLPSRW